MSIANRAHSRAIDCVRKWSLRRDSVCKSLQTLVQQEGIKKGRLSMESLPFQSQLGESPDGEIALG